MAAREGSRLSSTGAVVREWQGSSIVLWPNTAKNTVATNASAHHRHRPQCPPNVPTNPTKRHTQQNKAMGMSETMYVLQGGGGGGAVRWGKLGVAEQKSVVANSGG